MNKLEENFQLKTYQCNEFGFIKLKTLFDYLQELAGDHADKIGLGYNECIKKNCAWICAKYHLVIKKLPKINEKISIQTWPSKFIGPTGIREFSIKNENGENFANAVSQWVLIDINKLRPVITQNIFDCSKIIKGEDQGITLNKLSPTDEDGVEIEHTLRFDDIDINHHVNNAVYITFIEDCLYKLAKNKEISEILIDFKKSATISDKKIIIKSVIKDNEADFTILNSDKTTNFAIIKVIFNN